MNEWTIERKNILKPERKIKPEKILERIIKKKEKGKIRKEWKAGPKWWKSEKKKKKKRNKKKERNYKKQKAKLEVHEDRINERIRS